MHLNKNKKFKFIIVRLETSIHGLPISATYGAPSEIRWSMLPHEAP